MTIHLLPEPKELMLVKGMCVLGEETTIALPAQSGEGAWFAARQLQGEIENAMGLPLSIVKAHAPPEPDHAILLVCGAEQAAAFEVESFREQFPGRSEMIEYCRVRDIPVKASVEKPYSSDENCLHISYEAGKLEDLEVNGVELVDFGMTVSPQAAPAKIEPPPTAAVHLV